ncbi:hypothetical protein SAMN02983004_00913 [Borreliella japonica]|uniref:Uncharacterized protein n=1 Tax=Borreliella japonica TaxID=34095 RepID=A0A1G4Q4V8_BORJA|nr:hypothetical protein SAMN02983004_00913 [Borreliella japonica]
MSSGCKFAIFQISNTKEPTTKFRVKFVIQSGDNIVKEITSALEEGNENAYKGIELDITQIKRLSPIQESIIEFRDSAELKLIDKMFSRFSTFSEDCMNFIGGLSTTGMNNLKFLIKECNDENRIFLYCGANIHQFNSRFFQDKGAKESSKLLWMSKEDLEKVLAKDDQCQTERVFFRKVARNSNERTMISVLFQ